MCSAVSWAARCAGLLLWGAAQGAEDCGALVQTALRPELAAGSWPLRPDGSLPNPGSAGFTLTRTKTFAEPGSSLSLVVGHNCTGADEYGPADCSLHWGANTTMLFQISLAEGIRPGDIVSFTYGMQLKALNKSNPLSAMVPTQLDIKGQCGLCHGSCVYGATGADFLLEATTPTEFENLATCPGTDGVSISISGFTINVTSQLPTAPFPELQLQGSADYGFAVLSPTQAERVSMAYSTYFDATAGPPTLAAVAPAGPLNPHLALGKAIYNGLAGAVRSLLNASGVPSLDLARSRKPKSSGSKHVLVVNVTFKEALPSANVSLLSAEYCAAPGVNGSVSCRLPFGKELVLSTDASVALDVEEGSYANVVMKPKIGGAMGAALSEMLEPVEITGLPLCSDAGGTHTIEVNGMTQEVELGKCGTYGVKLQLPAIKHYMEEIGSVELPEEAQIFGLKTLDDLLPAAYVVDAVYKRKDNSSMLAFELALGLAKA